MCSHIKICCTKLIHTLLQKANKRTGIYIYIIGQLSHSVTYCIWSLSIDVHRSLSAAVVSKQFYIFNFI